MYKPFNNDDFMSRFHSRINKAQQTQSKIINLPISVQAKQNALLKYGIPVRPYLNSFGMPKLPPTSTVGTLNKSLLINNPQAIVDKALRITNSFNKPLTILHRNQELMRNIQSHLDKVIPLYEKYESHFSKEEFDNMPINEFFDYVDEQESQERFVEAFQSVFLPAPTYSIPTSYQIFGDINGSIAIQLNNLIETNLSSFDAYYIQGIAHLIFEHYASNYVNDITHYDNTSLLIQLIIFLSFTPQKKDTD